MRGLTDEERACLENEDRTRSFSDHVGEALVARGLLRDSESCVHCSAPESAGCECAGGVYFETWQETTTEGRRALRLDAAARALGVA